MIKFIGNANLLECLNVKVEFILILIKQSFYRQIIITTILEMLFQVKFDYLKEKNRDRAVNCNASTQTVIDNFLKNLSDDTVARIPKFKHI